MNRRTKVIIGLAAATGVIGAASLFTNNQAPSAKPSQPKNEVTELPTGEEPETLLDKCISPSRKLDKRLMHWGNLHVYLTRHDKTKALAQLKKLKGDGMRVDLAGHDGHEHNHDHSGSIAFPDVDLAVVRVDPFDGCEVVLKSLEADSLEPSDKITRKQVDAVHQAFWTTVLAEVETEFNLTPQSWLNSLTHSIGFGHRRLGDHDIAALKFLKMKLPEWYTKEYKDDAEHDAVMMKLLTTKADRKGKVPIPEDF